MHNVRVVMPFLQLFVSNILIVLVSGCTYTESGAFTDITLLYYKLDILIPENAVNGAFSGESRITIRLEKDMHTISFHSLVSLEEVLLHKINANSETVREPSVEKEILKTYKPRNIYNYELGIVMLYFDETIRCGYYMLQIKFRKLFTTIMDGFIRTFCCEAEKEELQWIVAIHSGVKGPQAIFPCWDNPRFTTIFYVSIRHPRSHLAYSNSQGKVMSEDNLNMWWTHFHPTLTISPHCITIFVLPRSLTQKYNKFRLYNDVIMWKTKTLLPTQYLHIFDFASDITLNVTKILKNESFFVDYCNVEETNYIPIKNLYLEIVVTPTYILYRENDVILSNTSDANQKELIARFLAEQITYQWMLRSANPFNWPTSRFQEMSKLLGMCIYYRYPEVFKDFQVINWMNQRKHEYLYDPSVVFDMDDKVEYEIIKDTTHFLCKFYVRDFTSTYLRN